jgi:hypothetical protein
MSEKQFNNDLACLELHGQASQAHFIRVCRCSQHQLLAKMLSEFLLETERCLVVDAVVRSKNSQGFSKVILRQALHANKQAATTVRPA